MLDRLWEHLAAAHVLDLKGQPFPVPNLVLLEGLKAGLLELAVPRPDDLSAGIHGHGGLLPAQLDHDGALVVAKSHVVGAAENA